MKLHNDKQKFYEAIESASDYYGIDRSLIEKDYFVTLFLKNASEKIQGLVFIKPVKYDEAIKGLDEIRKLHLFEN